MNPHTAAAAVRIWRASSADAAHLATLSAATFTETFGHLYPPEDLEEYLTRVCAIESCKKALEDPATAIWLAHVEGEEAPIGFVLVGRCKLPVEGLEPTAGEVKQLYVLSKFHNLRIGARLLAAALDWMGSQRSTPIYVGVWSENYGAQRFYQGYGFVKVGEYDFPVGKTLDREFIMRQQGGAHGHG